MIFEESKVQGLMGVEVRFTEESQELEPFMIVATDAGIFFRGRSTPIFDSEDMDTFARVVAIAWKTHQKLKPKLTARITGH